MIQPEVSQVYLWWNASSSPAGATKNRPFISSPKTAWGLPVNIAHEDTAWSEEFYSLLPSIWPEKSCLGNGIFITLPSFPLALLNLSQEKGYQQPTTNIVIRILW